jgi:methionine--tRNA ligase beta chain
MALLNRLDNYPFYLLGGYAEGAKSSTEAAMVLSSISSYLELAHDMRASVLGETSSVEEHKGFFLKGLDEILETNAFLVGHTFRPTLADYDVFYALCEIMISGQKDHDNNSIESTMGFGGDSILEQYVHLKRWIVAVQQSAQELVMYQQQQQQQPQQVNKIIDAKIPFVNLSVEDPVPVFCYGEQEEGITSVDRKKPSTQSVSPPTSNVANNAAKATTAQEGGKVVAEGGGKKELSEEEKKIAAEKRAKKAAEKKAKKVAKNENGPNNDVQPQDDAKPTLEGECNVTALDIRVGKILDVWEHEASDKIWCEKIDIGESEPRQILSGLRAFYKKEEMQGRVVLVLCNLKKRNLVGVPSHGMVLCASNKDHTAVEFVVPPEGAKIGERLTFEGLTGEPEPENKVQKKKLLEKLAPDLKTDGNGVVVWKGVKCLTSACPFVAVNGMKDALVS